MPATEEQYEEKSTHPGFQTEGQRIDHIEALEREYTFRVQRGDVRADQVADQIVSLGAADPREAEGGWSGAVHVGRAGRLTAAERDQLEESRHSIDRALTIDRQLAAPAMPLPSHRPPHGWEERI